MPPFDLRPSRPADAEAVLALWNRSAPHDPLAPALLAEKLADTEAVLVATVAGDLVGLGTGALWPTPGQVRGSVRLLAVDPAHRRRGVGTALLAEIEARLGAAGAEAVRLAECAPNYLTPGVDVRYDGGLAFATARGYTDLGEAVNLGVDLRADDWDTSADEARLGAEGVTVRRATEADRPALARLLAATWPTWQAETDRAYLRAPVSMHLALRDGDVLGFAAHDTNNVGTGWFGPMGTAEAARGLGIGGVLCRRCLADSRAQGLDRATIAWAAALPFYKRVAGADVERRFRRFEKAL
ncbi:MAG: GNAT family N-acetyltransferase [Bacteroidota bacterium]